MSQRMSVADAHHHENEKSQQTDRQGCAFFVLEQIKRYWSEVEVCAALFGSEWVKEEDCAPGPLYA